jgi:basic membrane lipoprotein Med (substrate-binding protein (PBP1-ABC) superfamily)
VQNWTERVSKAASESRSRTVRRLAGRPRIAAGIAAGLIAAVISAAITTTWALWPSSPPTAAPRARAYSDIDVCLLTDAHGISTGQANQAWKGLQNYSKKTTVRVSYVPVIGPANTDNASQFLAGLVQRHCRVIVAVGPAQVTAADTTAQHSPGTGFVLIAAPRRSQTNVVTVDPTDPDLPNSIAAAVTRLAKP